MDTNRNCHYFWIPILGQRFQGDRRLSMCRLFGLIQIWSERAAQRRRLAQLEDRMLKDIGLSRGDAYGETRKWFWQE